MKASLEEMKAKPDSNQEGIKASKEIIAEMV
jgi:hypothetical protein